MSETVWRYDDVQWGRTPCQTRCGERAEALLDGTPVCLGCGELLIDRVHAVGLCPQLRWMLPPLFPWLEDETA